MEALSNNAPHLSEETNSVFFRCEFCGGVLKIRFSASEPFTLSFFCCYCNAQNFFPLDNFFKLLSKEELNEYVTYSKSNFDFIKEKINVSLISAKKTKIIAFNVKQFFVLNVAVIIYITIGLILTIFLYQIVE